MRAGNLSDLLVFEERVVTANSIAWTGPGFSAMAEVQRGSTQSCRFVIHYRFDMTPEQIANMPATHRIIFENKIYSITDALADRKHTEIVINSDFSANREVTDLQSVDREYVAQGLPVVRPGE